MSDDTGLPRPPEGAGPPDDGVGRLIHLAGARPAVPEERLARVRTVVHGHWRRTVSRERRRGLAMRLGLPLATAAAVAILVGAGLLLRDRVRGSGASMAPVATIVRAEGRVLRLDGRAAEPGGFLDASAGLTSGADGRAALRTGSGASVRVDRGTELRLPAAGVLELERGAIYVDTGSFGARGAIEVRTPLGTIADLGTQFEVRLADDGLRLAVRSGAASLTRDGHTSSAPAGTRLRVDAGGAVETSKVLLDGEDWDWVQAIAPPFEIEGRTLGDYLDWLERETGRRVSFADPSIAVSSRAIVLHGSTAGIRPGDTPDAVLPACGLRHRLDDGVLVVERAGGGAAR